MAYTLGGTSLPNIQNESGSVDSSLMVLPFPMQDGSETDVFDFGGVVEEFTISGTMTDSMANCNSFIGYFKGVSGKINGNQLTTISLVSDLTGTTAVKVLKFDYSVDYGGGSDSIIMNYNIKLVKASTRYN